MVCYTLMGGLIFWVSVDAFFWWIYLSDFDPIYILRIFCISKFFFSNHKHAFLKVFLFQGVEKTESEKFNAAFHTQCFQLRANHSAAFASMIYAQLEDSSIDPEDIIARFNNSLGEIYKCMKFVWPFHFKQFAGCYFRDSYPTFAIPQIFNFVSSTMYAVTVYTTVGYGDLITRTHLGQFLTIAYGFFGIPLYIAFISECGDLLGKKFVELSVWLRNIILKYVSRSRRRASH